MAAQETQQGALSAAGLDVPSTPGRTGKWKRRIIAAGIVLLTVGGAAALLMQGIENAREAAERAS